MEGGVDGFENDIRVVLVGLIVTILLHVLMRPSVGITNSLVNGYAG